MPVKPAQIHIKYGFLSLEEVKVPDLRVKQRHNTNYQMKYILAE